MEEEKPQPASAERAFEAHETQDTARSDGGHEADPEAPEAPPEGTGHSPQEGAEQYAARHSSTTGHKGPSQRPVGEPNDDPSGAR